jgi:hypothetical protein
VQIGTKSIKLHPDRDEAYRRYHELMSEPLAERKAPANPNASRQVVELLNAFIEWARKNKPPRTYVWNKENIQNFVDTIPATLTIAGLKPYHATHAMDAYPHWAAAAGATPAPRERRFPRCAPVSSPARLVALPVPPPNDGITFDPVPPPRPSSGRPRRPDVRGAIGPGPPDPARGRAPAC